MKIKSDFVTNSSSSSFLVVFSKVIKSKEDLEDLIEPVKLSTVFEDCIRQKPLIIQENKKCFKKIFNQFMSGTPMSCDELGYSEDYYYDYDKKYNKLKELQGLKIDRGDYDHPYVIICNTENDLKTEFKHGELAKDFIELYKGKYLYIFEYGDEGGQFMAEMEHGNTFGKISHIQVSKH